MQKSRFFAQSGGKRRNGRNAIPAEVFDRTVNKRQRTVRHLRSRLRARKNGNRLFSRRQSERGRIVQRVGRLRQNGHRAGIRQCRQGV